MPKRSSHSVVRTWPRPEEVISALRRWARRAAAADPQIVRVVLFGSYARGDWGVGSDADVLIELARCDRPPIARLGLVPDPPGVVPVDLMIRTTGELELMRREGYRFTRVLEAEGIDLL